MFGGETLGHLGKAPHIGPGGGVEGGPIRISHPNVLVYYSTIGGTICRSACVVLGETVCAAIVQACATATVVTLGAMSIPCSAALIAACVVGGPTITQFCTDYVCPE